MGIDKFTVIDSHCHIYPIKIAKPAVESTGRFYDMTALGDGTVNSLLALGEKVVEKAKQYIGVPYVYGGSSPKGFDCSGFTSYVYKHFNVSLPHSSASQYTRVTKVSRDNLQPGDLVFFASSAGGSRINHVGIYVGNGNFIHAPRPGKSVCYDSLYSSYYSSHYVGAGTVY